MSKFIGIDISKNTFDLAYQKQDKWVFASLSNDQKGFKSLLKHLEKDDWVVMEASGALATYLYQKGYQVALENLFAIKGYSQMMLCRAKTDKKDAKTIAEYASKAELRPWKPAPAVITKLRHLLTTCLQRCPYSKGRSSL